MFPSNEAETIALYKLCQHRLGWKIVHLQTAFPDAVIEDGDSKLTVEFEYLSSNFKKHGHDPEGCDLIICYKDDWPNASIPVQALEPYTKEEVHTIRNLISKATSRYKSSWDRPVELPSVQTTVPKPEQERIEPINTISEDGKPLIKRGGGMRQWFNSILYNYFSEDGRNEYKLRKMRREHQQFCSICGNVLKPSAFSGDVYYPEDPYEGPLYWVLVDWTCEKCGYIRHIHRLEGT